MKRKNLLSFDLSTGEEAEHLIDYYLSSKKWMLLDWSVEHHDFFRSHKVSLARKSWLKKIKEDQEDEKEENQLVDKIVKKLAKELKK